ncbi:nuclear pore complex protein NUP98A-like [Scomber scombrus]|uniref:Nuclear pore complex protein NUP98A-like n=1 Tax=Scomber scombrus TaxID=13677 RepID=A0AAV1QFU5_SCOSC
MVLGLSLRVSWICLLLFSSGACFPATGDYKYPYMAPRSNLQSEGSFANQASSPTGNQSPSSMALPIVPYSSADYGYPYMAPVAYDGSSAPGSTSIPIVPYGGGSAPGSSNLQSEGSSHSRVHHQPSANRQLPGSVQHASSPTGNQSPSSMVVGSSASHQPSRSHVTYDSHIPIVPYSGADYGYPYMAPVAYDGYPSRNAAAGDHDIPFPHGFMNGAASGFAYPARNAGQPSRNTAAGYNALPYRSPVGGSSHSWDPQPEGAMAFPGFATAGAASDLNAWIEARPFIDLSFLESAQGMQLSGSQETSPPMPSSYIVQSRNSYVRDREAFSDKSYSPEFPEPPVMRSKSMSAPGIVSKGGKKV